MVLEIFLPRKRCIDVLRVRDTMGNLQSILGDCQIGQLPVYLQQFVAQEGGGDEAYVVYGSKRMFQGQGVDSSGIRDDDEDDRVGMLNNSSDLYYSGPSQKHVRANMIEKKEKERRQVLVDIVDLCVDGIDSVELANRRAAKGSREPGGQTYTSPEGKGDTYLNSEVWDEAEYRAHENGVMRVVPGKEKSREKSKGSSSKKSKKEKKTKKHKKTLVEIEPDEASAPAVDDRVNGEEDLGYVSDSKNSVDGMTTPPPGGNIVTPSQSCFTCTSVFESLSAGRKQVAGEDDRCRAPFGRTGFAPFKVVLA